MKQIAGLSFIFLFILAASYRQEPPYDKHSTTRLSCVSGNSYVQKTGNLEYNEAVLNMPISEGDRMATTDGRAEICLGRRNYIRLDNRTKIDFLNLPKTGDDLTKIQISSGNIYLSVGKLEKEKDIEVHTPDVSIYLLDSGLYRIDVRADRETKIFVFTGLVEAAGKSGSTLLKEAQKMEVVEGRFTSRPTRFIAGTEDSFDRWSEQRDSEIRKEPPKREPLF